MLKKVQHTKTGKLGGADSQMDGTTFRAVLIEKNGAEIHLAVGHTARTAEKYKSILTYWI